MKWKLFKRDKSLSKELQERNKKLAGSVLGDTSPGVFKRSAIFFKNLLRGVSVDQNAKEQIEEFLIRLDFGPFVAEHISKEVATRLTKQEELKGALKSELLKFYGQDNLEINVEKGRTNVLLIVGANGSGKTTSIAKLAHGFKNQGYKVLIIAGDTFRAGAVEQLNNWAKKIGIDITLPNKHKEDPSALIYRSLVQNKEQNYDVIICDTSGKQHNNQNLLLELNKIHKTIKKFEETAPHETFLVIDSTIGQTSLLQTQHFLENAKVTGIILTKMDRMTRGGIIFAIKEKYKVPVKLIGTGETLDDLKEFDLPEIVDEWTSMAQL